MTFCEKHGYQVGDRFIATSDHHPRVVCGEVITLIEDDGSSAPFFEKKDGTRIRFTITCPHERVFGDDKPSWDDIPSWVNWICCGPDGFLEYHNKKPILRSFMWDIPKSEDYWENTDYKPFISEGSDWTQTLEQRPNKIETAMDEGMNVLKKLALELSGWPSSYEYPPEINGCQWYKTPFMNWVAVDETKNEEKWIYRDDWIDKRERMINKPSWDDAPEDAQIMVQNEIGQWFFGSYSSAVTMHNASIWFGRGWGIWYDGPKGHIPAGHDWKQTLEKRANTGKVYRAEWLDEFRNSSSILETSEGIKQYFRKRIHEEQLRAEKAEDERDELIEELNQIKSMIDKIV